MKICLVDCLNFDPSMAKIMPYIPVGLLCVASSLEKLGARIELVSTNAIARDWPTEISSNLYKEVARAIADQDPHVIGFSTMCSSYHHTLRIATEVRKRVPQAMIVLGGPQATATCRETLLAFPQVDLIVCGEGDLTAPDLINSLQDGRPLHHVAGIAYRVHDDVYQTPQRPLVANLDSLPIPAYHLYKGLNSRLEFPLDVGRGCPYGCTFCQTSLFWERRYRLKSAARLVDEIRYLHTKFGARHFSLTHDMFTANKKMVLDFCQELQKAQLAIEWTCSARLDCVDQELLSVMAAAGCTGIFYGVETGSTRMQRSIRKNLDLSSVEEVVRVTDEKGMEITVAFMAGFPDEREEDLNETLCMIFELLRTSPSHINMSLLAPLNGTAIYQRYRDKLKYDGAFSTCTMGYEDDTDRALLQQYPDIFSSYYYIPCDHIERDKLCAFQYFVLVADALRLTCVAMADEWGGPWELFERWRRWVKVDWQHSPHILMLVPNFLQFLSSMIREERINSPYLDQLAALEYLRFQLIVDWTTRPDNRSPLGDTQELLENQLLQMYPMLRTGVSIGEFSCDVRELIHKIVHKRPLDNIVPKPTFLVTKLKPPMVDVIHVNRLTASLLQACTGKRKVESIIEELLNPLRQDQPSRLQQAYQNCLDGFKQLYKSGMIALSMTPHDLDRTVR